MEQTTSVEPRRIAAGDPLLGLYLLENSGGRGYRLCDVGDSLILRENGRVVGSVWKGSQTSGSVWRNGECIGEYSFNNGEYMVVPVVQGFLNRRGVLQTHPLEFLMDAELRGNGTA